MRRSVLSLEIMEQPNNSSSLVWSKRVGIGESKTVAFRKLKSFYNIFIMVVVILELIVILFRNRREVIVSAATSRLPSNLGLYYHSLVLRCQSEKKDSDRDQSSYH